MNFPAYARDCSGSRIECQVERPDWHNGFGHDPEEATRVRVRLLQESASTGESLVATHLPFPFVGGGSSWRGLSVLPAIWDY